MTLAPFPLTMLSYGDEIFIGVLPATVTASNYVLLQGVAYQDSTGVPNVFGFCCTLQCKACTTIPPCPPPPPPAPAAGQTSLSIYVKQPAPLDPQRLAGTSPASKYQVIADGDAATVLASVTAFHTSNFKPNAMAYHVYRITTSPIADLRGQLIVIPVATI